MCSQAQHVEIPSDSEASPANLFGSSEAKELGNTIRSSTPNSFSGTLLKQRKDAASSKAKKAMNTLRAEENKKLGALNILKREITSKIMESNQKETRELSATEKARKPEEKKKPHCRISRQSEDIKKASEPTPKISLAPLPTLRPSGPSRKNCVDTSNPHESLKKTGRTTHKELVVIALHPSGSFEEPAAPIGKGLNAIASTLHLSEPSKKSGTSAFTNLQEPERTFKLVISRKRDSTTEDASSTVKKQKFSNPRPGQYCRSNSDFKNETYLHNNLATCLRKSKGFTTKLHSSSTWAEYTEHAILP
ncbi:hypothetical protein BJ878DRAFT_572355 [Calycina marina]|uniref:Uncharacterized protein n=1 Tax=Calycina marina TaxID=1763456 RepID=A0A9P8CJ11_9HELO|nr:hypothetical protein BJ878DRAFT_572355 [Calycina marina]